MILTTSFPFSSPVLSLSLINTHCKQITSPHRDMNMAKKTVAGLSKRCEALAVPQAVLRCQKSQAPSHRGHMVKLRCSSHISRLGRGDKKNLSRRAFDGININCT